MPDDKKIVHEWNDGDIRYWRCRQNDEDEHYHFERKRGEDGVWIRPDVYYVWADEFARLALRVKELEAKHE